MERLLTIGGIVIFLLLVCLVVYIVAFDPTVAAFSEISQAPVLQGKEEDFPDPIKLTPEEREWVERVVMAEARGEPWEGQVAVAQVIRDRVRHPKFPDTVMGVLTQCNQFAEPYEKAISEDVAEAVKYAFDFECSIFPGKLLYFMNPRKARPKGAEWIRDNNVLKVSIGNHEFYGERGV